MEPEHISTIVIRVISKLRQKLPIVNQRSLGEKGAYMDKQIVMQGGLHQPPHKWTPVEIVFLLKYYPKYKSGNSNYNI